LAIFAVYFDSSGPCLFSFTARLAATQRDTGGKIGTRFNDSSSIGLKKKHEHLKKPEL
jgi:hypothetical protein